MSEETYHYATDKKKCEEMEKRYGWKLKRTEKTTDDILKAKCIFEGESQFPNYQEESDK